MRRLLALAGVMMTALAVAGCASTMTVSSHVQTGIDFGNYRTYAWGPADTLPTGDPRLDADPFFRDHLQGAVERQLAGRGFVMAEGTPDVFLHYHAAVAHRLDVNRIDQEHGYCYDADCQVRVFDVEEGTIVLDMMDARTNRLVWRGWAQTGLDNLLDNRDTMARRVEEAASRMLAELPLAGMVTARGGSQTGGRQ